jgi:hypothetical protein
MSVEEHILAADLIKSLDERPDQWRWYNDNYFQIKHASGILVWVANGEIRMESPYRFSWGFWDKRRLRRAFKSWRLNHGDELRRVEKVEGLRKAITALDRVNTLARMVMAGESPYRSGAAKDRLVAPSKDSLLVRDPRDGKRDPRGMG